MLNMLYYVYTHIYLSLYIYMYIDIYLHAEPFSLECFAGDDD